MNNNYINILSKEIDKPIYRIMPIHRLLEMFSSKELVLVPPEKWDDPFENLLLKGYIKEIVQNNPGMGVFRNDVYGQCWTLHRETDAMWRIYSADKQGVKIKTTVSKLIQSLVSSAEPKMKGGCFIGKVDYLNPKEIIPKLKSIQGIYGRDAAESLLYKRNEFRHEREIRLICTRGLGSVQSFSINPSELFDEIVFDPRMNEHMYLACKRAVEEHGFKKAIKKSQMYQLPKGVV